MSAPASTAIGPRGGGFPQASAPGAPSQRISGRKLFAFLCMVIGMFMAILDIQVVSASLSEIQAGISASADEIAWVQTSYLIAEVVMIPLSGFLSRALSTRWMFMISSAGFTIMSLFCATATSIDEMIVYRALQGFIGGGMIPTVFAAAFTAFPRDKQHIVSPIIGLVATLAPTVGPTVGGYLTDLFSWHWLFLINVGPGIFVTLAVYFLVDFDEPDTSLLRRFDWLGLFSMAAFLGSLEYVLEEGSKNDWFNDGTISTLAVISGCAAIAFFWRTLTVKTPIVDLRAFVDRNFATGCALSFVMGIGLYGLTYLYPVYLGRVRGFSALEIGKTMMVTGACMFISAPIAGRLSRSVDPRVLLAIGFAGFGIGTWLVTDITKDWGFWELFWPQVFRGVSMMLAMITINTIALGTLPQEKVKNAAGLFNLTRNLGGAVGLASINTILTERMDTHMSRLRDHVAWGQAAAEDALQRLTDAFQSLGSNAPDAALKQLSMLVNREAMVLAFGDIFFLLTLIFVALVFTVPFVKRSAPMTG